MHLGPASAGAPSHWPPTWQEDGVAQSVPREAVWWRSPAGAARQGTIRSCTRHAAGRRAPPHIRNKKSRSAPATTPPAPGARYAVTPQPPTWPPPPGAPPVGVRVACVSCPRPLLFFPPRRDRPPPTLTAPRRPPLPSPPHLVPSFFADTLRASAGEGGRPDGRVGGGLQWHRPGGPPTRPRCGRGGHLRGQRRRAPTKAATAATAVVVLVVVAATVARRRWRSMLGVGAAAVPAGAPRRRRVPAGAPP